MKISELKEEHPLIYEAINSQRNESGKKSNDVSGATVWLSTKEGEDFWAAVEYGDFAKAYKLCPHLKPAK